MYGPWQKSAEQAFLDGDDAFDATARLFGMLEVLIYRHPPQQTEPINYNPSRGGFMANLAGLAGFVSKLRAVRTNLVNELRHVDAALSVLGKMGGGSNPQSTYGLFNVYFEKRKSMSSPTP
jgi:hypothetical protein